MPNSAKLFDPRTGKRYPLNEPRWRSDDHGPLLVEPLPGIGKDDIDTSTRSLWRYRAAMPLDMPPVSLGEGCTPLVEKPWGKRQLLFKLDWMSPTGSKPTPELSYVISFIRQRQLAPASSVPIGAFRLGG